MASNESIVEGFERMDDQPRSTAKTGNPSEATRGKGYERALMALGNAIDKRLDVERQELELLSKTTGIPIAEIPERLSNATLGELTSWTDLINGNPSLFASTTA